MKKYSLALLIIAIVLMVTPAFAQEARSGWLMYLFDLVNGDLVLVTEDGQTEAFSLGLDENEFISESDLEISPDGSIVAYCKYIMPAANDDPNAQPLRELVIRDIEAGENLHEIAFGTFQICSVTSFNVDGGLLALSLVGGFEPVDNWSVRLIDVGSGETMHNLDGANPDLPAFVFFGTETPVNAQVRDIADEQVIFAAFPFVGTEGPATVPVYQWTLVDGVVTEIGMENVTGDTLSATGEVAQPALDESMVAAQPEGPLPTANIVTLQDGDMTRTIYENTEWVIVSTAFVNDGATVAVMLLRGFDPTNDPMTVNDVRYVLVNRDGTMNEIDRIFAGSVQVRNIPGGTVLVHSPNPTMEGLEATQIYTVDSSGGLDMLADYLPDYETMWSPISIVWVSASDMPENLPDFVGIE